MSYKGVSDLFKAAAVHWVDDYAQSMGAALAFYTMFSIAPLLLIVTAVAGLFFGEGAAKGEIFNQLQSLLGAQGGRLRYKVCWKARPSRLGVCWPPSWEASSCSLARRRFLRSCKMHSIASGGRRCGSIPSACGD